MRNRHTQQRNRLASAVTGGREPVFAIAFLPRDPSSSGPDPSPLKRPVWVELYPNGDSLARVYVDGESFTILDIELVDLLAIIDQTEQRKRHPAKGTGDGRELCRR